jgi:hypothetical protein
MGRAGKIGAREGKEGFGCDEYWFGGNAKDDQFPSG